MIVDVTKINVGSLLWYQYGIDSTLYYVVVTVTHKDSEKTRAFVDAFCLSKRRMEMLVFSQKVLDEGNSFNWFMQESA